MKKLIAAVLAGLFATVTASSVVMAADAKDAKKADPKKTEAKK